MSSVVIGAKDNLVKTDKNNTLTGNNTFNGEVNLLGTINGIDINDVDELQTQLGIIQTDISIESSQRISKDDELENSINLLNNNLNLKLNITDSIDSDLTFYARQGDNLTNVISQITAEGSSLSLGNGSFGNINTPLVINKQNICIYAQPSTPPITEILSPITIQGDRIRLRHIACDGVCFLNSGRSVFTNISFTESIVLGENVSTYMTFRNCEFVFGKTLTVSSLFTGTGASAIYFINCNFGGCNLVLNQQSASQVIFTNCANFFAFNPNATYVGINVLPTGYIKNNISKTILSNGSGNSGDVIVSGGENGLDSWSPLPTPPPIQPSGKCLEMICIFPSGGSIISVRGDTVFLQNPLQPQTLNQTFAVLEGSQIQYRPPVGTKTLIYSFYFHASNRNNLSSPEEAEFLCRVSNTNMEIGKTYIRLAQSLSNGFIELSVVFRIDPTFTQDIPNGILTDFNNLSFIRFQGRCPVQNGTFLVNNKSGFLPFSDPDFSRPKLKIEAYN